MNHEIRLRPEHSHHIFVIQDNITCHKVLHNCFFPVSRKIRFIYLLPLLIENSPRIQGSITIIVITGTNHTSLIIPVHNFHETFMGRLCIKNAPPFPALIMYGTTSIVPADLPVFRHFNLIKIPWYTRQTFHRLEISEEKAIYRHHIFRKKTVILDDCSRIPVPGKLKRLMQFFAVGRIVIQQ